MKNSGYQNSLWAADQFHRLTKKVKNIISSVEVPTSYFKANMIKQ